MHIGDEVIYHGRRVRLLGHDPMSVPERRAQVEDLESGERLEVAYDELVEPPAAAPGLDPVA